jgi:hypothetical protein
VYNLHSALETRPCVNKKRWLKLNLNVRDGVRLLHNQASAKVRRTEHDLNASHGHVDRIGDLIELSSVAWVESMVELPSSLRTDSAILRSLTNAYGVIARSATDPVE